MNHITIAGDIVCRERWKKSKRKVLHLLKEPSKDLGKSLTAVIKGCVRGDGTVRTAIWKNLARRSLALQEETVLPWSKVRKRESEYGPALLASAVLNLNSTIERGRKDRSRTNARSLAVEAKKQWNKTETKIKKLAPDVVICGGTYKLVRRLCSEDGGIQEHTGFFFWNSILFIDAYHPSYWGQKREKQFKRFLKHARSGLRKARGASSAPGLT